MTTIWTRKAGFKGKISIEDDYECGQYMIFDRTDEIEAIKKVNGDQSVIYAIINTKEDIQKQLLIWAQMFKGEQVEITMEIKVLFEDEIEPEVTKLTQKKISYFIKDEKK